jgi:hypothetical protein
MRSNHQQFVCQLKYACEPVTSFLNRETQYHISDAAWTHHSPDRRLLELIDPERDYTFNDALQVTFAWPQNFQTLKWQFRYL